MYSQVSQYVKRNIIYSCPISTLLPPTVYLISSNFKVIRITRFFVIVHYSIGDYVCTLYIIMDHIRWNHINPYIFPRISPALIHVMIFNAMTRPLYGAMTLKTGHSTMTWQYTTSYSTHMPLIYCPKDIYRMLFICFFTYLKLKRLTLHYSTKYRYLEWLKH